MAQLSAIQSCMSATRLLEHALQNMSNVKQIQQFTHAVNINKMCFVADDIFKILAPIIFIVGTIGNILSFTVLCRRPMTNTSSYIYLAVLALVDQGVLVVGLLRIYVEYFTRDKFDEMNSMFCKFNKFIGFTLSYISVWLIVIMTVERALAITLPLRAWSLSIPSRCKKIIIVMTLIICAFHFHWFFSVDIIKVNVANTTTVNSCVSKDFFSDKYWAMIDGALYSYLPFIIVTIANALIIIGIYRASNKRKLLTHNADLSLNQRLFYSENSRGCCRKLFSHSKQKSYCCISHRESIEIDFDPNDVMLVNNRNRQKSLNGIIFSTDSGNKKKMKPVSYKLDSSQNLSSSLREKRQLTILLLVISCLFLLLTGPVAVMKFTQESGISPTFIFIDTLAILSMYLNHSINFFLYCAMGNRFRNQLKRLFCPSRYFHQKVMLMETKQKSLRRACQSNQELKGNLNNEDKNKLVNNIQAVSTIHVCAQYSSKSTPSSSSVARPYVIKETKAIRWKWPSKNQMKPYGV